MTNMNLFPAILVASVLPILGSAPAANGQALETVPGKPNVLNLYIDDMGCAQPGCYGGTLAPTPHMDAIAAAARVDSRTATFRPASAPPAGPAC